MYSSLWQRLCRQWWLTGHNRKDRAKERATGRNKGTETLCMTPNEYPISGGSQQAG